MALPAIVQLPAVSEIRTDALIEAVPLQVDPEPAMPLLRVRLASVMPGARVRSLTVVEVCSLLTIQATTRSSGLPAA